MKQRSRDVSTPILGFHSASASATDVIAAARDGAGQTVTLPMENRHMNEWAVDQIQAFLDGMRHASKWVHDLIGLSEFTVDLVLRALCSRRSSLMVLDNQQILRIMAARGLPDWV